MLISTGKVFWTAAICEFTLQDNKLLVVVLCDTLPDCKRYHVQMRGGLNQAEEGSLVFCLSGHKRKIHLQNHKPYVSVYIDYTSAWSVLCCFPCFFFVFFFDVSIHTWCFWNTPWRLRWACSGQRSPAERGGPHYCPTCRHCTGFFCPQPPASLCNPSVAQRNRFAVVDFAIKCL